MFPVVQALPIGPFVQRPTLVFTTVLSVGKGEEAERRRERVGGGGKEGERERRLLNDADLGFRRHGPSLCMHPILPHLIPASCYEFNTDLISV